MNLNDYATAIVRISHLYTIPEDKKLSVYALGLAGETGEVCELLKKHIRDEVLDTEALAKELGDVLAYLTLIADTFGFTLNDIAELNLAKLADRERNGTLHGTGNER